MLDEATIESLIKFRSERDWEQFHSPKNLAVSISLESAELLEIFQWTRSEDEIESLARTRRVQIEEEVADLVIYLTYFTQDLGIDLGQAVRTKLEMNRQRYPVATSKGNSKKYDQ